MEPDAAADTNGAAPPAAPSMWSRALPVIRAIAIWYAMRTVMDTFIARPSTPTSPPAPMPSPSTAPPAMTSSGNAPLEATTASNPVLPSEDFSFRNSFALGDPMTLRVYVSPLEQMSLASLRDVDEQAQRQWLVPNLEYSTKQNAFEEDGTWKHEMNLTLDFLNVVRANESLYAHVFLTKEGYSPNSEDAAYDHTASLYARTELVTFRPRAKVIERHNLLGGAKSPTEDGEEEDAHIEPKAEVEAAEDFDNSTYVAMWKPTLTMNVIIDENVYTSRPGPPPFLVGHLQILPDEKLYKPVLYINEFWLLEEHLVPVNSSTSTLPLTLTFYPLPLYKFGLYTQMALSFKDQESMGTSSRRDNDSMKRMVLEANPVLLAITLVVSVFHSIFDFLAFKNDVSFWRNQKSLAGLSLRSLLLNTFIRLVSFLYLVDNETSWMVLVSSFISLIIEAWKITKAVTVRRGTDHQLVWSHDASYSQSPTAEHDRVAIAHLSIVLYPLLGGFAAYSLIYREHKGWYSWGLSTLTSFVYLFGFIMMTPQLYINYKLQSVAHLPWRAMVYKSLNTFIDDLFAFVIKMPWLYRISCFRDDIIFFIYLYQRWAYRVDKTRVNEYGQQAEPTTAIEAKSETTTTPTTPTTTTTSTDVTTEAFTNGEAAMESSVSEHEETSNTSLADADIQRSIGEYRMLHHRRSSKPTVVTTTTTTVTSKTTMTVEANTTDST